MIPPLVSVKGAGFATIDVSNYLPRLVRKNESVIVVVDKFGSARRAIH